MGFGVMVVDDPTRDVYTAWGLGLTNLRHFLGLRSVGRALSLATRGIHNRHPSGNRWQQAGTFGIDAGGTVRYVHLPEHAGDLPDVEAALAAVTRGAAPAAGRDSHDAGDPLELR